MSGEDYVIGWDDWLRRQRWSCMECSQVEYVEAEREASGCSGGGQLSNP